MKILITGGAGFIGCNLAHHFLNKRDEVTIYDNLFRKGTEKNIEWLRARHANNLRFVKGDIRDYKNLEIITKNVDVIYHLAAQVAVTTSITNPREDFEINVLGTLNVLEAVKAAESNPILIFTSTNKVYGAMENCKVIETISRYEHNICHLGVSENHPLDFYSPYGCSKGAADQYVHDYAKIFGLKTVVFRMSCIYGARQFGNEDQGWVAHFIISSLLNRTLTVYGNGKQVRDILYIDDLIRVFELATINITKAKGEIYNIGGGSENSISLLELITKLEDLLGRKISYTFDKPRPGDQPIYISNIKKAKVDFGWEPRVSKDEGIKRLVDWVQENKVLFNLCS
jgi:CDP-paratose 2-epimerase